MKQYFNLSGDGIVWDVKNEDFGHRDNFEFSGKGLDCIVDYGVDENGVLTLSRYCAFPTLRMSPNNTHGTLAIDYDNAKLPKILINGTPAVEYGKKVSINGILAIESKTECGVQIKRTFVPDANEMIMYEIIDVTNSSECDIELSVTECGRYGISRGVTGIYVHEVTHDAKDTTLAKGDSITFCIYYSAYKNALKYDYYSDNYYQTTKKTLYNYKKALKDRIARVNELSSEAALDTGNAVLDIMYRFAKIRAGESIFNTKGGLFHSPGGRNYYAATWCNDQVEYAGPWFAFTDDVTAVKASVNAYEHYTPFMTEEYMHIPTSVIAEGTDIWEGAGDRGDAAMYLYGGSLFALTNGNKLMMENMWPALRWCAEYCQRKTLPEGVIESYSDELEGRFPTDRRANLSTSCLAYGGYKYLAMVAQYLEKFEYAEKYVAKAESLKTAIVDYFGAELHGYNTYRYSKGFDTLRAWICLPMCMGITDRLEDTLDAMFSEYLWNENGMLSCEIGPENKSATVWDRASLYGFKGAFMNGRFGNVWTQFFKYCNSRLLGERVPYAIEAWPEGARRHLSAESALFCRIIPEGILSIRPENAREFSFIPRITEGLDKVVLSNFRMCGDKVTITVTKDGYEVTGFVNSIKGTTLGERVSFKTNREL